MEGVWTYVIPQAQLGGVLTANNGKLYGGDIGYFLHGSYSSGADSVEGNMDASLFNPAGVKGSAWGDRAASFKLAFNGKRSGDTIAGQIRRHGFPQAFNVTLTRKADAP